MTILTILLFWVFLKMLVKVFKNKRLTGLIDFSKALDSTPCPRLLLKLRQVGYSDNMIQWFASHLSGRLRAVKCENSRHSDWLSLSTRVPQGSVIGPLLFSIFVLNLLHVLNFLRYTMFDDDFYIYRHTISTAERLNTLIHKLSTNAEAIIKWSLVNDLKLNSNQTVASLIGSL